MRRSLSSLSFYWTHGGFSGSSGHTQDRGPQPMTGPDAPFGSKFKKAYDLALEEINAAAAPMEEDRGHHRRSSGEKPSAATVTEKLINSTKSWL